MKSLLKPILFCAVAVALLVMPQARTWAQGQEGEFKPAVVISIASLDEQLADVEYLMRTAGQEENVPLVKFMVGAYADGVDKKKPAGGVVTFKGVDPQFMAFVPVTDLDKVLEKLQEQVGEAEDVGDGVLKVSTPDGEDVFIKEQAGYAYVSNDQMSLTAPPADPTKLLGGLDANYNIAVQVNAQNIPDELKQFAVAAIKQGYEESLEANLEEQDPETRELTKKLGQSSLNSIVQMIEESDQLTIGWGVDAMARSTFIDFSLTAIDGTKLAKRMEVLKDAKSNYTGFLLPGAAATLNFVSDMSMDDVETLTAMLTTMRQAAMKELDNDEDLNAEQRAAAKDVLGSLIDVIDKTIASGKLDGGGAVLLETDSITFAAGGYVADGKALDDAFKRVVELAKNDPEFPGVKLNADSHANVTFHTMMIPVPEDEGDARKLLGDEMEVAVGIGDKSVYVAFGKDSLSTLKKVIDESAAGADQAVPPSQLNISLTPIMKFAASVTDDPNVAAMVETLEGAQGKDKVSITSKPIERGATTRLVVDEGVLQVIGEAVKVAQQNFGGGGDF